MAAACLDLTGPNKKLREAGSETLNKFWLMYSDTEFAKFASNPSVSPKDVAHTTRHGSWCDVRCLVDPQKERFFFSFFSRSLLGVELVRQEAACRPSMKRFAAFLASPNVLQHFLPRQIRNKFWLMYSDTEVSTSSAQICSEARKV